MIPLGRSIPNISGPTGATPSAGGDVSAAFNSNSQPIDPMLQRRRSSLDTILGHLKYVGAFPSRVMQDFSHPLDNDPVRLGPSPGSTNISTGSLLRLVQKSDSNLFNTLSKGYSLTDVNRFDASASSGGASHVDKQKPKIPTAEAFLSL